MKERAADESEKSTTRNKTPFNQVQL